MTDTDLIIAAKQARLVARFARRPDKSRAAKRRLFMLLQEASRRCLDMTLIFGDGR